MKKRIIYISILVALTTITLTGCKHIIPGSSQQTQPSQYIDIATIVPYIHNSSYLYTGKNKHSFNSDIPPIFISDATGNASEKNVPNIAMHYILSKKKIDNYNEKFFKYLNLNLEHMKFTFWTQYALSILIFIIIISIVYIGLRLSWNQFNDNLSYNRHIKKSKKNRNLEKYELKLKKIQLKKHFIALIIFTISLVFLLLYLFYVYPIEFINKTIIP
jgi:hypothetical protein